MSEANPSGPSIPLPPVELRRTVGTEDVSHFENPTGGLIFGEAVPADGYDSVLDFGCGCGRTARQMMQQRENVPSRYLGVDLYKPSIDWCVAHLTPANSAFEFKHVDAYSAGFNPQGVEQTPIPSDDSYTLINAHSVFTHIVEPNLAYYWGQCIDRLAPGGHFRATWFLFDKAAFPMMMPFQNCLYINLSDASNATIYDRNLVRALYRESGLRLTKVAPPSIRGHQWEIYAVKDAGEDVAFPDDDAPIGEPWRPGWIKG